MKPIVERASSEPFAASPKSDVASRLRLPRPRKHHVIFLTVMMLIGTFMLWGSSFNARAYAQVAQAATDTPPSSDPVLPPTTPLVVSVEATDAGVVINWSESQPGTYPLDHYQVQRSDNNGDFVTVATVSGATTYSDPDGVSGQWYRLIADDNQDPPNESDPSTSSQVPARTAQTNTNIASNSTSSASSTTSSSSNTTTQPTTSSPSTATTPSTTPTDTTTTPSDTATPTDTTAPTDTAPSDTTAPPPAEQAPAAQPQPAQPAPQPSQPAQAEPQPTTPAPTATPTPSPAPEQIPPEPSTTPETPSIPATSSDVSVVATTTSVSSSDTSAASQPLSTTQVSVLTTTPRDTNATPTVVVPEDIVLPVAKPIAGSNLTKSEEHLFTSLNNTDTTTITDRPSLEQQVQQDDQRNTVQPPLQRANLLDTFSDARVVTLNKIVLEGRGQAVVPLLSRYNYEKQSILDLSARLDDKSKKSAKDHCDLQEGLLTTTLLALPLAQSGLAIEAIARCEAIKQL